MSWSYTSNMVHLRERQRPRLALLLCVSIHCTTIGATSFRRVKSDARCPGGSDLGFRSTLQACADACAARRGCVYFTSGKGDGKCSQDTSTPSCFASESYILDEAADVYVVVREGMRGCTDNRAKNYLPEASLDDGSCESRADPCVSRDSGGQCANCVRRGDCTSGNDGYRNAANDTVKASRVADGSIHIDGDLRDWAGHDADRCYENVAFATTSGDIVVFESYQGGVWYGPADFSVRFMLAWDSTFFYVAAEVTDDVLTAADSCYKNGLQAAFEVGGPMSPDGHGLLQARRSHDLDISRLHLINMGLEAAQVGVTGAACSSMLADPLGCCFHFEKAQFGGGGAAEHRTSVAVLRNPMTSKTTFEVAFQRADLEDPANEKGPDEWKEGRRFGFAFLVNDGDEAAVQQGWAGYYPHAIVHGWNGGQKQPWKVGTVQLTDAGHAGCGRGSGDGGGGGGAGLFFVGALVGVGVVVVTVVGRRYWLNHQQPGGRQGGPFSRRAPNAPLAAADHMSATPALMVAPPSQPSSSTM